MADTDVKHLYLAGWELEINGDEQCYKFIQTQAIDAETAKRIDVGLELVFTNNRLSAVFELEDGEKSARPLSPEEEQFEYVAATPHQMYEMVEVAESESYLGGETPADFHLPKFDFTAPFQYLGKLSKSDQAFNWLPFDLHLTAPVYLDFNPLFIDYSDPMRPQVMDVPQLQKTGSAFEDLQPDTEVVFKKVPFKTQPPVPLMRYLGHTGVPNWIQYPEIPTCPKSNKTMRFVCQLGSDGDVTTTRTNIELRNLSQQRYFDHLNFWSDGELFVFFEPESSVACFFIQNT